MGRRSLSRAVGLVVCALLAVGCGKRYMDLPPMQFYSLLTSNKKVHVIDVRTPQEYADEHIKGALNLPVSDTAAFWASVDSLSHKDSLCRVLPQRGAQRVRCADALRAGLYGVQPQGRHRGVETSAFAFGRHAGTASQCGYDPPPLVARTIGRRLFRRHR